MQAQFDADVAALAVAGAEIADSPLPDGLEEALPVHRQIMAAEAWRNLGPLVSTHAAQVSAALRDFVEEGRGVPDIAYQAALDERARLIEAYCTWLRPYDAVLTPAATGEAPGPETTGDPRFCTRWTLLGAPALTLPTGLGPNGLPLGLQLAGMPGDDPRLLAAASWVEAHRPFAHRPAA
jgi:Asp-tRNA(Asn)/Glu-tRNA(Gln) amidotransferase A subunit family amidase